MIHTVNAIREQPVRLQPRVLRVGLAGCGVVGSAFVRLLNAHAERFLSERNLRIEIARVLVRDSHRVRPVALADDLLTTDLGAFIDTDCDLVVEAIGGVEPAFQITSAALKRGARVVTANKALIAAAGPDLVADAYTRGGSLDFEAAVAGGVPVVRTLRSSLAAQSVRAVRGILNGTTNYILNAVEQGTPFVDALAQAQICGFAEADPTRDIDGTDAREKLAILAWLAWGIAPKVLNVRQVGIQENTDRRVNDALALGGSVRLIAEAARHAHHVSACVEPVIVAKDSDWARTSAENNLVRIEFDDCPPLQLSGPGAGGLPTASSLLADVLQACTPLPAPGSVIPSRPDAEDRSWLISVKANGAAANAEISKAGLATRIVQTADGITRFAVGPCGAADVTPVVVQLRAAGYQPAVSRLELAI